MMILRLCLLLLLGLAACSGLAPTATLPPATEEATPTAEPDPCQANPLPHSCSYGEAININPDLEAPFENGNFTFKAKDNLEDKTVDIIVPGPLFQGAAYVYEWDFSRTIVQDGFSEFSPAAPNHMWIDEGRIAVDFEGVKGYTTLRYHALQLQAGIAYVLLFELDTTDLEATGSLTYGAASRQFDTFCYLVNENTNRPINPELFPQQPFPTERGAAQYLVAFRTNRDMSVIVDCGWQGRAATLRETITLNAFRIEAVDWDGVGDLEALTVGLELIELR